MAFLVLKAYCRLILFDVYLLRGDFQALRDRVSKHPVRTDTPSCDAIEQVCAAVDTACIWYWKEALCLQRSAVTACLLRSSGVPAQMCIGVQQMPFKAHAWVEVNGRIVNDKIFMRELYAEIDKC